jgi:hypothetical protein
LAWGEPGTLLGLAIHPPQQRVHVDEGERVRAGQQRRARGQLDQQVPAGGLQLAHMPEGERAQERTRRGRCVHPVEQATHAAVAQQVQVVDAVRAGGHAGHDRGDLATRVRPGRDTQVHPLVDQPGEVGVLGQPHHRDQPGTRHQIRLIKDRVDTAAMRQSHLKDALSAWVMEASATPILPGQRASSRPPTPRVTNIIGGFRLSVAAQLKH